MGRDIENPAIYVAATIHQEMPAKVVELLKKEDIKIKLDKAIAKRIFDQAPGIVARDGCISSPSGPSC